MRKFKDGLVHKEGGITLIGLMITVVIMLIIAGVSIYNGTDTLEDTRLKGFYTQLEIVQKRVDDIAATDEKYIDERGQEVFIRDSGEILTANQEEKLLSILQIEQINTANLQLDRFRYFTINDIKNILDLQEIEYDLFINFEDRIIIAESGITIEDKTYYVLKNEIYFVETDIFKNSLLVEEIKYSRPIKYVKDTYKVIIIPDKINGNLTGTEYVKYKKTNTKYWETSGDMEIIMEQDVEYNIKYCYSDNFIESIIKIEYEKDEDGNLIKDELDNYILTVKEIIKEQESEED